MSPYDTINVNIDEINVSNKFGISVDVVLLGYSHEGLKVLVIDSDLDPYRNLPSLLGTLVKPDELLNHSARRVLHKYTGSHSMPLIQIGAFDGIDRHPIDRVFSVAYLSMINLDHYNIDVGNQANPHWRCLNDIPEMAFDHKEMVNKALAYARSNVDEITSTFPLLHEPFTIAQLRRLQETVLGASLDKRNFRKRILKSGLLKSTGQFQERVSHRPAELFMMNRD